ncbi:UDP-glucose/GDP-mannose dehydrogenase family protein [Paenibacillus aurantius]|uniref:UDP-glucose 6-dehydrogenase n=1 Tax=Paenibacillus aurantius TaxID=2918900 RepID=A0AA96RGA3_9BACL|nr:UDP-glucose/GDP-mannose dehydrogenase family protein [Paenibacillus aurantius]WNQ12852.1 UDP-glucose/GDP-mannose dehydrogenase family protein [Paenibacillus aurantius]
MNIVCIGAGYVGSVTAAAFAVLGHTVTVIDLDPRKIEAIRAGTSPIYEPGLQELLHECAGTTLFASHDYDAVGRASVVFICVGTPSKADLTADLSYVKEAARTIGRHLNPDHYTVIVNKSTVPVGTADLVSSLIEETSGLTSGKDFDVVSNPEFLREGYAVEDVFYPDRIIIGTDSSRAKTVMRSLYGPVLNREGYEMLRGAVPAPGTRPPAVWFESGTKSAELIKYASNAFLAVKISYINEMARLCETLGADVTDVAKGMGLDSRIGHKFLEVSSGWSGSCFPKDTAELLATSRKYGCEQSITAAAVEANDRMLLYCVSKVQSRLKSLPGKTVGLLGLTFKPNTDDARQTQAQVMARQLESLGARVKVHDPQGMEMFRRLNPDLAVEYCESPEQVLAGADAAVLLTHWDCYLAMDWESARPAMKVPYLLDTRNVLDSRKMLQWGYVYEGLGK